MVMVDRDVNEGRVLSHGKTQERLVPARTNSRCRGHPGMGMSFLGLKKLSKRRGLKRWQYFPGVSDSKEFTYNAGDMGLIPGSGRSLGEGNDKIGRAHV